MGTLSKNIFNFQDVSLKIRKLIFLRISSASKALNDSDEDAKNPPIQHIFRRKITKNELPQNLLQKYCSSYLFNFTSANTKISSNFLPLKIKKTRPPRKKKKKKKKIGPPEKKKKKKKKS